VVDKLHATEKKRVWTQYNQTNSFSQGYLTISKEFAIQAKYLTKNQQ